MQTFLVSTAVVSLAEIGDKTQILSMILAAQPRSGRFRRRAVREPARRVLAALDSRILILERCRVGTVP
jgi:putative Ca2+/H+ antiporter (TMEM165/GDT1 family)